MQTTWIKRKWDVAVLIITVSFLLCSLGAVGLQGREQAKRTVCAAHISQNTRALLSYASDYDGTLPRSSFSGWLQDQPLSFVNNLLSYGATQETFYCPSNEMQQKYLNYFWLFGITNNSGNPKAWQKYWDGQEFINNYSNTYLVAGYFFLLGGRNADIQGYASDTEEKVWLESVYMSNASSRELVTDNIMGTEDTDTRWGYNFGQISGGLAEHGIYERSNHLISNEEPAGGNVGFLDGHVSWRRWDPPTYPMVEDGKAVPRWNASGPACWW